MDSDPFKFWSDFFSNATRDQRRIADAWGAVSKGISTLQDLTLFWQKMMGMEKGRSGGPDSLKMFSYFFPFTMGGFSSGLGMVPVHEHLSLVRKYEEMKERVAAHEETIQHLRLLLESRGCERKEPQTGFQDLMKSQADAFFAFLRGMQSFPYK